MSETKSPAEQLLDLVFYAPLGFIMNAQEIIPQLVEKGRQQIPIARMFGQFAVEMGGKEAGKAISRLQGQAAATAEQLGRRGSRRPRGDSAAASTTRTDAPAARGNGRADAPGETRSGAKRSGHAAALAIPDYDSLSASQVVPRLAGLSADELEAVRAYEAAHRGRKTILSRVAQLQTP